MRDKPPGKAPPRPLRKAAGQTLRNLCRGVDSPDTGTTGLQVRLVAARYMALASAPVTFSGARTVRWSDWAAI